LSEIKSELMEKLRDFKKLKEFFINIKALKNLHLTKGVIAYISSNENLTYIFDHHNKSYLLDIDNYDFVASNEKYQEEFNQMIDGILLSEENINIEHNNTIRNLFADYIKLHNDFTDRINKRLAEVKKELSNPVKGIPARLKAMSFTSYPLTDDNKLNFEMPMVTKTMYDFGFTKEGLIELLSDAQYSCNRLDASKIKLSEDPTEAMVAVNKYMYEADISRTKSVHLGNLVETYIKCC